MQFWLWLQKTFWQCICSPPPCDRHFCLYMFYFLHYFIIMFKFSFVLRKYKKNASGHKKHFVLLVNIFCIKKTYESGPNSWKHFLYYFSIYFVLRKYTSLAPALGTIFVLLFNTLCVKKIYNSGAGSGNHFCITFQYILY